MFHFGILASFLWVWFLWPLLGITGFISLWLLTRSASYCLLDLDERSKRDYEGNPFAGLVISVLLILSVVHFGGIYDVVKYVTEHYPIVLMGIGAYCVIGVLYMLLKGAYRVIRIRSERVTQLIKIKREYIAQQKCQLGAGFDAAQVEAAAQDFVAGHDLSKPIQVNKHKARMTSWAILWLPDLLYHTVFQFFDRLKDAWDIVWNFMKGFLQSMVNRYWGNLADQVNAADKNA